ncbi:MAG: hypothetical protein JO164_04495 [Candidatus Eremiobacteraeota bacterium]|nr:hypothetical protein [Candidatus Eremiobacteraeota bacterium]
MNGTPETAAHLAELEARYDAHLGALRHHAESLGAAVDAEASALAERAGTPPPSPAAPLIPDGALLPDDDL